LLRAPRTSIPLGFGEPSLEEPALSLQEGKRRAVLSCRIASPCAESDELLRSPRFDEVRRSSMIE
jgi:hypothetical protein